MKRLLTWYDLNPKDYPWRKTKNPYLIWVSEIVLQQTRVIFGLDYYQSLIEAFPTIESLANATEQKVLTLWQGLGYYSRARNLHETAKYIHENLNDNFPNSFQELKKRKGIGDYTAAAIASICFDEKVPALDGNAFRVYSRQYDLHLDFSTLKNRKDLFQFIQELMDSQRPGDYNQAIMDLGSRICLPKKPKCKICPINDSCLALERKTIGQLPIKNKLVKIKDETIHFVVFHSRKLILLKRKTQGIWKNLFLFPSILDETTKEFEKTFYKKFPNSKPTLQNSINHNLTHKNLTIHFWEVLCNEEDLRKISENHEFELVPKIKICDFPLPKPIENHLKSFF